MQQIYIINGLLIFIRARLKMLLVFNAEISYSRFNRE